MQSFLKAARRLMRPNPPDDLVCSEIFDGMAVTSDGKATCSCVGLFEGMAMGNAHHQPLREIFDGAPFRDLRRRMISGDLPPFCQKCALRSRPRRGDEAIEAGPIRWLQVEPAFACNLRCPDCALTRMTKDRTLWRPFSILSEATFQRLIEQAAPSLRHLLFHMLGEPFLNRQAGAMLAYARRLCPDAFISMDTNGCLVDAPLRQALIEARVDYIKFSIDGASQQTYERYRVGGDFGKVYENMVQLVRERANAGATRPYVVWQYVLLVTNDSDDEIRAARRLARDANVDHLMWLISHSPSASKRFLPDKDYPILNGERESCVPTIELAALKHRPMIRPPLTAESYNPWK